MISTYFPNRTVVSVEGAGGGLAIACDSGAAWITQCCDATDHVLTAGMDFATDSKGRIVVQILRAGNISIRLRRPTPADLSNGSSGELPGSLRDSFAGWCRRLLAALRRIRSSSCGAITLR